MTTMLSVIVVSYNVESFLYNCLKSVYANLPEVPFEVIVVDNHSHDRSVSMIRQDFPQVRLIENAENIGFARANNLAIKQCCGEYVLLLNPDTLIKENTLEIMAHFMDRHEAAGIAGCRVLNEDGTLQLACRRMLPTPLIAFFRTTGLSKLFPNSRLMARYNLTYLDPSQSHEVDAVSGAFLLIRKKVIDEIGLLDERFFMYGEELDWCLRAKNAGWKVMYCADAEIIHFKGESSKFNSRKAAFEFYRAMFLFHKKHFARRYSIVINALVYTGIFLKALLSCPDFLFSRKVGSKR